MKNEGMKSNTTDAKFSKRYSVFKPKEEDQEDILLLGQKKNKDQNPQKLSKISDEKINISHGFSSRNSLEKQLNKFNLEIDDN